MNGPQPTEEDIFRVAHEITSPEARMAYLKQVCRDANEVERVVELLKAGSEDQSFLENGPAGLDATEMHTSVTEKAGESVGPYKLLQQIGEGGFGVVYMAEQTRPVRRKVALKVIKPGMDTKEVIARFEAERQALALMDHPNIAKIFDGGTTRSGRPYFVMELVKGIPLTKFCDENKMDLRRRLELFATVCKAIQHAHHKGVIHRDIKPSNVLVTLHDGVPVPKVIDFGVSKAISQQLTEKTMFTAHGQMIGTPQYMSPEQAEMSGLDIDTRSDIYSLGILLYELLTGVTPLDPKKIRGTAYFDLQRMIREDEPVVPSFQFSMQSEQSATIATQRQSDPQKLGSQLKGELDWIVMKSLDKDRNRRYDSANAMAADVENYLNNDTVEACPPTLKYRFQKYARRHKSVLLTGGSFAAILIVATVVSLFFMFEARYLLEELRKEKTYTQQTAINQAVSFAAIGNFDDARKELAKAELEDPTAWEKMIEAQEAIYRGESDKGIALLKEANQLAPDDIIIQAMLANAYLTGGIWEEYARTEVSKSNVIPETSFEKIFVGHALAWTDIERSRDLLDEAVDKTNHPWAYIARARTLSTIANITKNEELMEHARKDAKLGTDMLSESATAHSIQLSVLLDAYDLYKNKLDGKEQEANASLDAAEISVKKVEQFSNSHTANIAVGHYYLARGDHKKAMFFFRKSALARSLIFEYAIDADRNPEQVVKAIATLSKKPFEHGRSIAYQCVLLLDQRNEAAEEKAEAIITEYLKKGKDEKLGWVIDLALLTGKTDEAQDLAKYLVKDFNEKDMGIRSSYLEFHAADFPNDKINAYVSALPVVSWAPKHFHVGLRYLAGGDRKNAKIHFLKTLEFGVPLDNNPNFARAFLKRMEADSEWPHWIKNKNSGDEDNPNEESGASIKPVSLTEPVANPRVVNFYANQAKEYLHSKKKVAEVLPHFPGIDGENNGHWGTSNEEGSFETQWNAMDVGGLMSAVVEHHESTTPKAVALELPGNTRMSALFDPTQLSFTDLWTGGLLEFPERRFGVAGSAIPKGEHWASLQSASWQLPKTVEKRYRGFYRNGSAVVFKYEIADATVFDHAIAHDGQFIRTLNLDGVMPLGSSLVLMTSDQPIIAVPDSRVQLLKVGNDFFIAVKNIKGSARLSLKKSGAKTEAIILLDDANEGSTVQIAMLRGDAEKIEAKLKQFAEQIAPDFEQLTQGGPARWQDKTVVTQGKLGKEDGAYAIDTLVIPYRKQNPFGTPFRASGIDFLSDGRAVVSTLTGDIWLVDGIDDQLKQLTWKRIAAGLNQPLGVLVQNDIILVAGRDQITRLHDLNGDEEIDFYECITNEMKTEAGHMYLSCLQEDADHNLYFSSASEGVMKYNFDKEAIEILGNGIRYTNGMGVNSDGSIVLATAQEGEWTPATAIFEVGKGSYHGWYGPLSAEKKYGYDLPLCFVPRGVDFSAGEIGFLPDDERLGPLAGKIIGLSHGNCSHYMILREEVGDVVQGGIVPLPGEFLSGSHRIRFNSKDGHVYVVGTSGWTSYAKEIGSLQRVRLTGKALQLPTSIKTHENGLMVQFNTRIDPKSVSKENVFCEQWNYIYGPSYGSSEFCVGDSEIQEQGHSRVSVKSVQLMTDGKTIFLEIPQLHPVMQFHLFMELIASNDTTQESRSTPFESDIYYTIKQLGEPFVEFPGYTNIPKNQHPDFPVAQTYPKDPRLVEQEKLREQRTQDTVYLEMEALPGLQFTPNQLQVKPGKHVVLKITNRDSRMQHNFVLVRPGQLNSVGEASMILASDPQALATNYVPADAENVICFSAVINPNSEYTLDFIAPQESGAYPFFCTFPGHWKVMQGTFYVTEESGDMPLTKRHRVTSRKFIKMWEPNDLIEEMATLDQASLQHGSEVFNEAGCIKCHTISGQGAKTGPDLSDIGKKFQGETLLHHILKPSAVIHEKHQTILINTLAGKVISGMVIERTDEIYRLLPNPLNPEDVIEVPRKDIGSSLKGKASTMPEGLLMTFTKEEIRDLVGFLQKSGAPSKSSL
ncbi:MAG: hypothetical protein COA78_21690 [Blastopirellula sp.]|nr:MAG: hypothetical protein COA78_21690 [Blastopirellula sp.]